MDSTAKDISFGEYIQNELDNARLEIMRLEAERNALIQALRIVSSQGQIDVVKCDDR